MDINISQNEFNRLATVVFHQALADVNEVIQSRDILLEPSDVSCASFLDYLSANHQGLAQCSTMSALTMRIYQKAVNDIAFQSADHSFSLQDISLRQQQRSCELSLQVSFSSEDQAALRARA